MDEPRETWVEKGRVLVREGHFCPFAFLVLEGRATVSHAGRRLTTLGPGATIGDAGAHAHTPRITTVTAASRMRLRVWSAASGWRSGPG